MTMIMLTTALLLPTALGFLVITLMLREDSDTGFLERISLAYPLGAGVLTLQMFFFGLLRIPLTFTIVAAAVCSEIILSAIAIAMLKIRIVPSLTSGLITEIRSSRTKKIHKIAMILLCTWIAAKLVTMFLETGFRPIFAWDTWANWSTSAKLFYYSHSLLLDSPPQYYLTAAVSRITTYPPHNPLMQVWISLCTGSFDEVLVKFWTPAYLLSASIFLYLLLSRELNRLAALAILAIFLGSPLMSYHAIESYSDLALGIYLLFASAAFLRALRGGHRYWSIMGLFSAEAIFTKEEALFFVLPLLASAVYFILAEAKQRGDTKQRWGQIRYLTLPLILIVPWFLFKIHVGLGLGAGSSNVGLRLALHFDVLGQIFSSLISLENFNIFIVFFPLLLLFQGKPDRETAHVLFAFLCYAVFFLSLYLFTEYYKYIEQGTIIYRNILTGYPVLCLLSALLLKRMAFVPQPTAVNTVKKSRRK
jgi:hypothetical protein